MSVYREADCASAQSETQADSKHRSADRTETLKAPAIAAPFNEVAVSSLPPELANASRWIGWRFVLDEDRGDWTKVPMRPSASASIAAVPLSTTVKVSKSRRLPSGWAASTDKPDSWGTLDEALAAWRAGGLDGLGFVFDGSSDGIIGIDLDDVRDPSTGRLLLNAVRLLDAVPNAYAEVSPSGTGLKCWVRATLPNVSSRPASERAAAGEKAGFKVAMVGEQLPTGMPIVEVFSTKYFTLTGHAIAERKPDLSIDSSDALMAVLDEVSPQWRERVGLSQASPSRAIVETKPRSRSIQFTGEVGDQPPAEVLDALNEAKCRQLEVLWRGDRLPTMPSESDADWMLARLLVEGGITDEATLKRLMLESPRGRTRAKLRRPDYLAGTIANAIAKGPRSVSSPSGGSGSREPIITVALPESGVEVVLSDDGIAAAFVDTNHHSLRFDNHRGRWMRLERGVWQPDETSATPQEVRLWCRRLADLAIEQHEPDARTEARLRDRLGSTMRAISVETFARRDERVSVTNAVWDRDPMLAGTPDGVLDLATGELRPATGEELITRRLGTAPAPRGTDCPRWRQSIHEWMGGDPEMIAFAQRWCGYLLTGMTSEHAIMFNHGPPAAGKSRFLWAISRVLGDYATTAAMETFTERAGDSHSCELAALAGARLVTASETQEGRYWSDARIKQLSGGDPITARWMRQDPFVFEPDFKLVLAGNHRPRMRNPDPAIGRRLHLVHWNHTPEKRIDLDPLHEAELPAILRWCLDGTAAWLEQGLNPPPAVVEATQNYLAEEDEVGHWLSECVEIDPERADWFTPTATLVHAANEWRSSQGDSRPWKARDLTAALSTRGASQSGNAVRRGGARLRGWFGVRLLDSHEIESEQLDPATHLRIAGIPV